LMSLSIPLLNFPVIYWYAIIGIPLFLAAFFALHVTGFNADRIGLNGRSWPWQLMVGLTGLGFGYVEYMILRPEPLVNALTLQQIWFPALVLLIFTGFLEEIIFRGLIQRGALGTLGRYGLVYVAILFAILHLGYRSLLDVVFVFLVALFFGFVVNRTGSILGVTLSHGLTNISLYLLIPFLINAKVGPATTVPPNPGNLLATPIVWINEGGVNTANILDENNIESRQINGRIMAAGNLNFSSNRISQGEKISPTHNNHCTALLNISYTIQIRYPRLNLPSVTSKNRLNGAIFLT
jgi:membrane protease YdiL (CAAX protease family)